MGNNDCQSVSLLRGPGPLCRETNYQIPTTPGSIGINDIAQRIADHPDPQQGLGPDWRNVAFWFEGRLTEATIGIGALVVNGRLYAQVDYPDATIHRWSYRSSLVGATYLPLPISLESIRTNADPWQYLPDRFDIGSRWRRLSAACKITPGVLELTLEDAVPKSWDPHALIAPMVFSNRVAEGDWLYHQSRQHIHGARYDECGLRPFYTGPCRNTYFNDPYRGYGSDSEQSYITIHQATPGRANVILRFSLFTVIDNVPHLRNSLFDLGAFVGGSQQMHYHGIETTPIDNQGIT